MVGAIACGDNVGIRGAGEFVDHDASVARQPGAERKLDIGYDTYSDDDQLRSQGKAVAAFNAIHTSGFPHQRPDLRPQVDVYAMLLMIVLIKARDRGGSHARHETIGRFENGNRFAELGANGGGFQADESTADDDQVVDAAEFIANAHDVIDGP